MPSGFVNRIISRAICFLRPASRMEVNMVLWSTRSNDSSLQGTAAALPVSRVTVPGRSSLALAILSGSRSKPVICSGLAPHLMNSRSQNPSPHPSSKIFFSCRSVQPIYRKTRKTRRSHPCIMNRCPGLL